MEPEKNPNSAISQWIISLAMSVASCAVLFVIFASYIFELNEKISTNNLQLSSLQQSTELVLRKLEDINKAQQAATAAAAPVPVAPDGAVVDPAAAPAEATPQQPVVPVAPTE